MVRIFSFFILLIIQIQGCVAHASNISHGVSNEPNLPPYGHHHCVCVSRAISRERTFTFDHNFWSHAERNLSDESEKGPPFSSQADVYRTLGEFLVDNAYNGFNCSLFAYGKLGEAPSSGLYISDVSILSLVNGNHGATLLALRSTIMPQ